MSEQNFSALRKLIARLKLLESNETLKELVDEFFKVLENDKSVLSSLYYLNRKKLPKELRKISQLYAFEKKLEGIPTQGEIQDFAFILETSSKIEIVGDKLKMINYENFQEILLNAPKNIREMIQAATLFGECVNSMDESGRLSADVIIQFILLKSNLWRYRATLAIYDEDCTGYINRQQMMEFLKDEIFPLINSIRDLDEHLWPNYVNTVMSTFFFFLDPNNFGRCRITDVVVSGFLENIFLLQNSFAEDEYNYENWFSPNKTEELCSLFHMMDEDGKGHLTMSDFSRLSDGAFTTAFIERLFEIHAKDGGQRMSYDEFLVFQIANEHLAHPAAIKYFFKVLDLNEDGFLTFFELKHFYKTLKSAYNDFLADADAMPEFNDFADSMIDLARPADKERISLNDLIECKQGHEFIMNLTNYVEFSRFENKEDGGGTEEECVLDLDITTIGTSNEAEKSENFMAASDAAYESMEEFVESRQEESGFLLNNAILNSITEERESI